MKRTKAIIITIILIMAETMINQGFQNPPGVGKSLIYAAISESAEEREDSEMAKTTDRQIVNGETYLIMDTAARVAISEEVTAREADVSTIKSELDENNNILGFSNYAYHKKENTGSSIATVNSKVEYTASAGDIIEFGVLGTAPQNNCVVYVTRSGATSDDSIGTIAPDTYKQFKLPYAITAISIYCAQAQTGEYILSIRTLSDRNIFDRFEKVLESSVNKNGINQVKKKNLDIIEGYENLLNPDDYNDNTLIDKDGHIIGNSSYLTTGYIKVVPGQTYIYIGRVIQNIESGNNITYRIRTLALYDNDKEIVAGGSNNELSTPLTIPDGVYFIRFSVLNSIFNYRMFVAGSDRVSYIPYGADNYKIGNDYIRVEPSMTSFMEYSRNQINPDKMIAGYINQNTGRLGDNDSYRATDYLSVTAGKTYGIVGPTSNSIPIRYAWFSDDKEYISGDETLMEDVDYILTAPDNAKFIRFSVYNSGTYLPVYFAEATSKPTFEEYGGGYIKRKYLPEESADDIILNIPKKIYAVVGYELNIYFENITEKWEKYSWDVTCTKGQQFERGYRITPTSEDVGSYVLSIKAMESENIYKEVTTTIYIASSDAGQGITNDIIVLGDSTTNSGYVIEKLNENFTDDAMAINTLGTRGTAPNNHEGRSGWTFNDYFNPSTDAGVENPWYNPETQTFDADYYFANSGIEKPDWLFINLGINDTFGYTTDSTLETGIATIKSLCDAMIESILTASPSTKIGLCLTIPPNHSQDAFGKAYANGQTRNRYKRNNAIFVSKLIEEYDDRENESIYLIPIHTNLDTVYNMGMEQIAVNARNTVTTYMSPIGNGGVHPVISGYWQIADVYTAFLKAQTSN